MADTETQANDKQQEFAIHRLFVKDISFETPHSPQIFNEEWKPQVKVDLHSSHEALENNLHAVTLKVTVTAELEGKVAFLVEVQQAGIFLLNEFEASQQDELLGSFCPNVLFPYAREVISSVIVRGGFPPLYLAPVNFDAIYQQNKQQTAANH